MVKDWETSHLDSQVGYVYNRPVCFQVQFVSVDSLLGGGVLLLNHNRMASSSRQDANSIGQDRNSQQDSLQGGGAKVPIWRIGQMFDILTMHHDNAGNYN